MSKNDLELLDRLRDYYQLHRLIPSFADIAKLMGMKSTSNLVKVVNRLKVEGYLESSATGRLAPAIRFFERQTVETISASGTVNTDSRELISIDQMLVKVPSRTVLLKVKGDSMVGAGILDGDSVVVQRGAPALPGQIVAAIVNNEFAIRYLDFEVESNEFYLRPANPAHPPINPGEQMELFGRVIATYRSY